MKSLYRLVGRIQRGEALTPAEHEALGGLVLAMSVAVDMDADPRAPWTAPVKAYRELLAAPDGGVVGGATVTRLRPCPGTGS